MLDIDGFDNPGWSQKSSDWLAIPLHWHYHTGALGIDVVGVQTWERNNITQVKCIDNLCARLGVNLWRKAGIDRTIEGASC